MLLHCFAGCGGADVIDAAGLDWRDLFSESERRPTIPTDRVRRQRHAPPITAGEAFGIVAEEVVVVLLIAADLELGEPLDYNLHDHLRLAVARITACEARLREAA